MWAKPKHHKRPSLCPECGSHSVAPVPPYSRYFAILAFASIPLFGVGLWLQVEPLILLGFVGVICLPAARLTKSRMGLWTCRACNWTWRP